MLALLAFMDRSFEALGGLAAAAVGFALLGGVLGRCVTAGVLRLIHDIETSWGTDDRGSRRPSARARRGFECAAVVFAVVLFAWEVALGGLEVTTSIPGGRIPDGEGPWMAAWPRAAAHLVLFAFMAAAFWCDVEYRLIPDAITVPGALAGMLCVGAFPDLLLPVGCEQAREFAAPLVIADVLGSLGPLRCTATSPWFGPAPFVSGLVSVAAAFVAWWLVCTQPAQGTPSVRDPRSWLLPAGLAVVVALWAVGGSSAGGREHFRAAQASLFGAAVSGGIVWSIRAAASRALGREAMGLGDVTLMAMVGAWCGWQHGVLTFFAGAFIGLAQGMATWLRHRDNELPYGPSLCLAAGLVILAWRPVWQGIGVHFDDPALLAGVLAAVIGLTGVSLAVWSRLRD